MPVIARSITTQELAAIIHKRRFHKARRRAMRILNRLHEGFYRTDRGIRRLQYDMKFLQEYDRSYRKGESHA